MSAVALLSHRFGNIGHNFMALGAEAVAQEAFGPSVEITHFEQHHPFSIYPHGHWLRWIDKIPHGRMRFLRRYLGRKSVYEKCWTRLGNLGFDLAVACGGPNLVSGAANTPEMRILMHHFNGAFASQGIPLYDAAIGSGFPLERVPDQLNQDDQIFYRQAASYTTEISVREPIAARIYSSIGVDTEVIPCIAVGSGRYFQSIKQKTEVAQSDKAVVINFQAKGSNTDWGQGVDEDWWMNLVRGVISDLTTAGEKIILLCHSAYEFKLAKQLAPELKAFFPQSELEYGKIIANAKVGFVSRIHAGVALAGIGVPSIVVGNDTRIGTTEQFGLPSIFTKELTRERIVDEIRGLIAKQDEENDRLIALREQSISRYAEKFIRNAEKRV